MLDTLLEDVDGDLEIPRLEVVVLQVCGNQPLFQNGNLNILSTAIIEGQFGTHIAPQGLEVWAVGPLFVEWHFLLEVLVFYLIL